MDGAINHFIEAGRSLKAIEAAIQCRQFSKAAAIIDGAFLEPSQSIPFYRRIAQVGVGVVGGAGWGGVGRGGEGRGGAGCQLLGPSHHHP
jgi:hypothetical protein